MKTKKSMYFLGVALTAMLFLAVPNKTKAQITIVDNVYHITDQDFDEFVKEGVVLVDFWATWCAPCRQQAPIIDEIAQEIGQKAKIAKLDVGTQKLTANKYNIRYIPSIIIFKNGNPVEHFIGLTDKQTLVDAINMQQ